MYEYIHKGVYPISLGRVDPSTLSHGSSTNLCSGSTPYPPPSVLYCALQATPPSPATACSPRLEPAPVYRPLPYLSPNAPRSGIHALPPLHRYSTGHASLAGDLMVSAARPRAGLPRLVGHGCSINVYCGVIPIPPHRYCALQVTD